MPALSCFQAKRDLVGFSAASSGKAPGIAPPAAFSRYKDLHPSLFSCFLHLFFHISLPYPRSFSYCKDLRNLSHSLLPNWLLPTIADRCALTFA